MAKSANRQNPAETPDEDNPEWTAEDFSKARPASEVLPEIFPKTVADVMLKRGRHCFSYAKQNQARRIFNRASR
ncbi:MAG: hypothetical protein WB870_11270 [Gallionellaceae bacterium]